MRRGLKSNQPPTHMNGFSFNVAIYNNKYNKLIIKQGFVH